jgi:hypothetical protein
MNKPEDQLLADINALTIAAQKLIKAIKTGIGVDAAVQEMKATMEYASDDSVQKLKDKIGALERHTDQIQSVWWFIENLVPNTPHVRTRGFVEAKQALELEVWTLRAKHPIASILFRICRKLRLIRA